MESELEEEVFKENENKVKGKEEKAQQNAECKRWFCFPIAFVLIYNSLQRKMQKTDSKSVFRASLLY